MSVKKTNLKKTQLQRAEETKQRVLLSACKIFGEKGYENTLLDDIAVDIGLTISPIYHHFGNKLELFAIVTEFMENKLIEKLEGFASNGDQLDLQHGWKQFVNLCQEPGFAQIVLIDSPHVLGRDRWKTSKVVAKATDIILSHGLPFVSDNDSLLESDHRSKDKELVIRMLMAALAEAALMIGQDPEYSSNHIMDNLFALLKL